MPRSRNSAEAVATTLRRVSAVSSLDFRMRYFRCWSQSGSSGGRQHALILQQLLQFAGLEHLADDVAAADELALDVELGNGRPVAELLDALAKLRILQHVHAFEPDAELAQDLHHRGGEAA